jgi:hypothetical protein
VFQPGGPDALFVPLPHIGQVHVAEHDTGDTPIPEYPQELLRTG